jgi:hypothetical protein
MIRWSSAIACALALSVPGAALAQDLPRAIDEPPRGPGTEQPPKDQTPTERVRPGWEGGVQVGGGIGVGIGARVGYSFVPGLYAGGSMMHFFGNDVVTLLGTDTESQTLFGGDLGFKIFVKPQVELRPFVFGGIGIFNRLNQSLGIVDQSTELTISPSFLAAYHFGNAFFSAETRLQVQPTPVKFAVLGGLGLGI